MTARFSLRDLFWLTLVIGLSLAWWLDRRNLSQRELRATWNAQTLNRELVSRGVAVETTSEGIMTRFEHPTGTTETTTYSYQNEE